DVCKETRWDEGESLLEFCRSLAQRVRVSKLQDDAVVVVAVDGVVGVLVDSNVIHSCVVVVHCGIVAIFIDSGIVGVSAVFDDIGCVTRVGVAVIVIAVPVYGVGGVVSLVHVVKGVLVEAVGIRNGGVDLDVLTVVGIVGPNGGVVGIL